MLNPVSDVHARSHRPVIVLAAALLASCMMAWPAPVVASPPSAGVAVRIIPEVDVHDLAADHVAIGITSIVATHGLWRLETPDIDARDDLLDDLEDDPRVRWAVPDVAGELPSASFRTWAWADGITGASERESWREQPVHRSLGLTEAHAASQGAGVTIAILDGGIDRAHPAFAAASFLDGGWDLVDDDADTSEPAAADPSTGAIGHGTAVAGLAHLVAPEASLLAFRVLDADGVGSLATMILGIELAVEAGADVINLSFGTPVASETLERVIDDAHERGVVFVAAAGNRGTDVQEYPARLNDVIAVAAVDDTDTAAPFTSDGNWVDLAAPGVGLLAPGPARTWALWDGTSMAAPLVAGQAAILRSLDRSSGGNRSADDIADVIDDSVIDVTRRDSAIGEGRIDVGASVHALLEP